MFDEMIVDNVPPKFVIYGSVLKSCITLKTLPKVESLHMEIAKEGQYIFDSLPNRDLVLWNALLSGYVEFGLDNKVLHWFTHIRLDSLFNDVSILACVERTYGNLKSSCE